MLCLRVCATLLAASLTPALLSAVTETERGLAVSVLVPRRSAAMLSVMTVESEGRAMVFDTAGTLWFLVGFLACAGDEDDGVAMETEIVVFEWAAATFSGKHAVVKPGDMLDSAYDKVKNSAIDNEWSRLWVSL